jgi:CheY-like chemotaxis protein
LTDTPEEENREDKERRALVFASEERAVCFDSRGAEHNCVRVESFSPSEDSVYVLGIFEKRASRRGDDGASASDLARSQALTEDLQNILRALPVGVMILDDRRNVLYANDEFYHVWDLPRDNRFDGWALIDVIRYKHKLGRYVAKVTPEQILARREAHFQVAKRDQQPVELGWVGGKRVLFDGRSLSNGRVLLSYADVTAVREREREVHERRAALEHLGNLMHDATRAMAQGLLIVQDGIILLASEPLSDILAIPPEYLAVGREWIDLLRFCAQRGDFHGQEDEILMSWRDKMAAKKPISTPFHVAGERWVNLDVTISERQHWIALFTDVTEAREREAELARLLSRAEAADRVKSEFAATARQAPKRLPINMRGAHVLIVDDNAVDRQILVEQLALWGFDAAAAEDGPAALAILEAAHEFGIGIDAVVLDYQISGMNGAEIARKLRADNRFERLPIIFLTSMDISGTEKEFAALNGQAHLMKPARANVLRKAIVDVVRARRTNQIAADVTMLPSVQATLSPLPKAQSSGSAPAQFIDVLVAEDNEVNQIVFTQILRESGRSFLVVGNGQEAVEAWHRYTPRIIMMDVSMPVMNGHDATRAIRDRERGQGHRVPIVGVSAHALEADRDLCLGAGMDDYMSKPFSPELLEEKLELWLGRNKRQAGCSAS